MKDKREQMWWEQNEFLHFSFTSYVMWKSLRHGPLLQNLLLSWLTVSNYSLAINQHDQSRGNIGKLHRITIKQVFIWILKMNHTNTNLSKANSYKLHNHNKTAGLHGQCLPDCLHWMLCDYELLRCKNDKKDHRHITVIFWSHMIVWVED